MSLLNRLCSNSREPQDRYRRSQRQETDSDEDAGSAWKTRSSNDLPYDI